MSDQDNGSGCLEVGTNDRHEVVVNLPRDMTGHIVFSVNQARAFADSLNRKAGDAARAKYEADAARARAEAPAVDRSKLCTTNGKSVDEVRAGQTNETGQHDGYIVLCAEERAKGFVRPYRDSYKHLGRSVARCLGAKQDGTDERPHQCERERGHDGDHEFSALMIVNGPAQHLWRREGGCGTVTTMGRALSETYARDPTFYSHTFCVHCNQHLPVAEFVWTADGQQVGS